MKLIYFCNLFIICSSAFIIQPSYNIALKSTSINKYTHLSLINNNYLKKQLLLKKNNDDDNDIDDYKKNLAINIIYNIILYSYIFYLIIISKH